jgi:hypothetical protein
MCGAEVGNVVLVRNGEVYQAARVFLPLITLMTRIAKNRARETPILLGRLSHKATPVKKFRRAAKTRQNEG